MATEIKEQKMRLHTAPHHQVAGQPCQRPGDDEKYDNAGNLPVLHAKETEVRQEIGYLDCEGDACGSGEAVGECGGVDEEPPAQPNSPKPVISKTTGTDNVLFIIDNVVYS